MRNSQLAAYGLLVVIVLFAAICTSAQTPTQAQRPISTILNADGSIKPNTDGSLDPSGYRLTHGPNGEPRFLPAERSTLGGCNNNWDSIFTVNGANSSVSAVVSDGAGNIYVGGAFAAVSNVGATGIAKWDGTTWSTLGSGVDGSVSAIAIDGGNVYVAGAFTSAGGVPAKNVAKWDGTLWSAFGPGIGGTFPAVNAIAVSGNDVYVGGTFNSTGGFPNHVAHWDGTSWNSMGTGMDDQVFALAILGGEVYAGGRFDTAGGVPAKGIAKWDGTSWSAVGSGVSNWVQAIAVSGTDLYVGGGFVEAGGTPAANVAKWDGSMWSALGSGTDLTVDSIAVAGSDVYFGGRFSTAGGVSANRIAKWNGSGWSQMGTGFGGPPPASQYRVNGIAVLGNTVMAGGSFETADGIYAQNLAVWSGGSWSAFEGNSIGWTVRSVAASGTDVYVVGDFDYAGSVLVNNVAKWDGTAWSALGTGIPGGFLNAVSVSGNKVYVGGNFSTAGGNSARNIAMWDGTSWSQLGSGLSNGVVFTINVVGTDVYVGGSFTSAGGVPASNIAKWDGSSWSGLNSPIATAVTAIVPSGNILYVGASTNTIDSPNYFLKYDGTTWTPLGQGMTGGGVSSIAVLGSDVFVAGGFSAVGGVSAARIAKYDGNSWSALGAGLPSGFGTTNSVKIAVLGSDLFAVGDFKEADGAPGNGAASWNGNSWTPLGAGLGGLVSTAGNSISAAGDSIYVGGFFLTAGCNVSPYFARWRQTTWTGSVDTDWHTAGNWGSGSVPPPNVGVTIESNDALITTADVIVSSLIVRSGRTLTIGAGRTLTVTGDLYLENGNLAGPGTLIVDGNLTLDGADIAGFNSININGTLALNAGNISGTGPVSVNACVTTAIAGGSSASFVSAPLKRCVNASGTYRFPVGTAPVFSPVELANVVGSGNFTVDPRSGAYSGPADGLSNNRLLRWWGLTNGGITKADVTFDYPDEDVVGDERRYSAFRVNAGSATRIPTALNRIDNRATVFGVSTFSPWTLAESEPTLATLSGRLTTPGNRGAESVIVSLTDGQGNTRYAVTNPFGYFRFFDVTTFQIYTVRLTSKKFTFTMPVRMVDFDEFSGDVNFVSTDH